MATLTDYAQISERKGNRGQIRIGTIHPREFHAHNMRIETTKEAPCQRLQSSPENGP
jgi:hypothetical protein